MLKAVITAMAVLIGTPALAEIVFQQTGDNARNLEARGSIYQPTSYRATFDAPGFDPGPGGVRLWYYGVAETFSYANGELIDQNDGAFGEDIQSQKTGTAFVGDFTVPEIVDRRDETGTGLVYQFFFGGREVGVFIETFGGQPVPWTFTVETIAAVPEPASWAMMISGFGVMGTTLRRQNGMVGLSRRKLSIFARI